MTARASCYYRRHNPGLVPVYIGHTFIRTLVNQTAGDQLVVELRDGAVAFVCFPFRYDQNMALTFALNEARNYTQNNNLY